jgi:hypothetical protein
VKIDVNRLGRELGDMPLPRLQARYAEVFGEAARSNHREYLIKRVLWRVQANALGDLSERAAGRGGRQRPRSGHAGGRASCAPGRLPPRELHPRETGDQG